MSIKTSPRQQKIILSLLESGKDSSSSEVHNRLTESGEKVSLVTVKRVLSQMAKSALLRSHGSGPATVYGVSSLGRLTAAVDARKYCGVEPDRRFGLAKYNPDLLTSIPAEIFSEKELKILETSAENYKERIRDISETIHKKELERLVIELAWKSSKIEGNTYSLLDTEKLILEHKEAPGHDKKEARMILNHKDAFAFVYGNRSRFRVLTKVNLEKLHEVLVKDLNVAAGLRKKPVGVVSSKYQPLDNVYQITEAVENLAGAVARANSPYAKALIALLGISYIQPFEDGNKRTARLMADALLMAYGMAPLSYRSVDETEYREAMFVFYEINSLVPFKKIFIAQYEFAAANYAIKV